MNANQDKFGLLSEMGCDSGLIGALKRHEATAGFDPVPDMVEQHGVKENEVWVLVPQPLYTTELVVSNHYLV